MIGALFIAAKLACIYLPNGKTCLPIPQLVFIAGARPTAADYPRPRRNVMENIV